MYEKSPQLLKLINVTLNIPLFCSTVPTVETVQIVSGYSNSEDSTALGRNNLFTSVRFGLNYFTQDNKKPYFNFATVS